MPAISERPEWIARGIPAVDLTGWITYGNPPAPRPTPEADFALDRLGAVDRAETRLPASTEAPVDPASGAHGPDAAGGHAPLMPASGRPRLL